MKWQSDLTFMSYFIISLYILTSTNYSFMLQYKSYAVFIHFNVFYVDNQRVRMQTFCLGHVAFWGVFKLSINLSAYLLGTLL